MRPALPVRDFARHSLLVVAALALVACAPADTDPGAPATTPSANDSAVAASPPATSAPLSAEALDARIDAAVADQRLFAPAGDNAIEYYLLKRERIAEARSLADAALIEIQPYAMIAAEQAIAGGDFVEAERLVALMTRIDPTAPALTRLNASITEGREAAEAQAAAAAAAEAAAEAEALAAATPVPVARAQASPAATRPGDRPQASATAQAERPAATPSRAAAPAVAPTNPAQTAAARATPPPAPTPRPAAAPITLVPITTPDPPFPSEAIARGRSMGSVTVRYTVSPDGRVRDVRVIEARPGGLFERTVMETMAEWRFEPIAESRTQTRTFEFRN